MAVAVKNAPGTSAARAFVRPAYVSLLGTLYIIVVLGLIFYGLPALAELIGLRTDQVVDGFILGLAMLAAIVAALYVGGNLLLRHQGEGVRAGIFVGFVGFLIILGLTRWASVWFEYLVFFQRWGGPQGPMWGAVLTGAVGLLLLGGAIYGFLQPWTQKQLVLLDEGGWFHATSYKPLQGIRVRRATIFGLLVLVGSGIYTLLSHGTLSKGSPDWKMEIPFTPTVALTSVGDAKPWLEQESVQQTAKVKMVDPGKSGLPRQQIVRGEVYKKEVESILNSDVFAAEDVKSTREALVPASQGPVLDLLVAVNNQVVNEITRLLDTKKLGLAPDVVKNLRSKIDDLPSPEQRADIVSLLSDFKKQVASANKTQELGPVFRLPIGLLVVSRYAYRDLLDETNPSRHVKIAFPGEADIKINDKPLAVDQVVSTRELDEAIQEAKDRLISGPEMQRLKTQNPAAFQARQQAILQTFQEPERRDLVPPDGTLQALNLTLLPAVRFTFPLLLLAAALWLSWRIVNMPAFADFLIATEAEVNKVSWTTQRRLIQDTIVVLVTVVLMAGYLFTVDQLWRVSLSSDIIKVLQIPREQSDTNRSVEQKNW